MSGVDRRPANGRGNSEGLAKQSSVCWLTVGCVGTTTNAKTPSRALGCFFIVPFFALGLFFTVMVVHEAIASAATYARQIVPCQIVESEVRESSSPFSLVCVHPLYIFHGQASLRSSRPFETYREALLFTRRWPVGSRATCYLDPRDPAATLLERNGSGLVLLLFLPLPLFFVFIGRTWDSTASCSARSTATETPWVWHPANPIISRQFRGHIAVHR